MQITESRYAGVYQGKDWLLTPNRVPGSSVYGEPLYHHGGQEFRPWNPYRSKLAALLKIGCPVFPFTSGTRVLYLGAGTGTTVSHLSDLLSEGRIYAVEISEVNFRDLLELSQTRGNIVPLLQDARQPSSYARLVEPCTVLYQDVAQPDQEKILEKNLGFLAEGGVVFFMIKARSIRVGEEPGAIYQEMEGSVRGLGLEILGLVPLEPFEMDHAALVAKKA